jgi:hypothetical protein
MVSNDRCESSIRCYCFLIITAASNSTYYGYPELWILRYPAHRYRAVPSPGFETTTLWLKVRRPNHSATTLQHAVHSRLPHLLLIYIIQKTDSLKKWYA